MIGEKKIVTALSTYISQLDDEAFRSQILRDAPADRSAAILAQIEVVQSQLDKLTGGIARADNDYYMRGILDEERHQAIVSGIKKQVLALQAELTQLQDALHEEERHGQREQTIDDMRINGLVHLSSEDVRAANAYLRRHFQVWFEKRRVTDIVLLV